MRATLLGLFELRIITVILTLNTTATGKAVRLGLCQLFQTGVLPYGSLTRMCNSGILEKSNGHYTVTPFGMHLLTKTLATMHKISEVCKPFTK